MEINNLRNILNELKEKIFSQEELITPEMKERYGDTGKYIIFISFSDGKSRAQVCKGIGNSLDTSWKNAVNLMGKAMKELQLDPIWIKADIVKDIKEYTRDTFNEYLSHLKPNFLREGISFDNMFNTAFLEQEANANEIIKKNKETNKMHIAWKRLNQYRRKSLGLKFNFDENSVKNVYTFKTISFFHDGIECYRLSGEQVSNGRREIKSFDKELFLTIVRESSDWLIKQVDDTGKFCYGYFPCFDKVIPGYNIMRHAGTIYSMIELYEITRDSAMEQAIKLSLAYLLNQEIETFKGADGINRAFVIERGKDEIKLGANAIVILTLEKYHTIFGNAQYLYLMEELAEGIDFLHNKHDGSFVHVLNYPDLSLKDKHRVIFYDGEAAFALMRLYGIDKNERWLALAEQAFKYFIQNNYWKNKDHWMSYASCELVKHKPERQYIEFNLKNTGRVLDTFRPLELLNPARLELLMATYTMINKLKDENLHLEILNSIDEEKLLRIIEHYVEHQLDGYVFPEVAMYFQTPQNILGGFYMRHDNFRIRIDDIQHSMSGLCSYYHQILNKV